MSARSLYRLAGLALLVGGVLSAITGLVSGFTDPVSPLNFWLSALGLVGAILILCSIGTFYGTFAHRAGALGVVGYILLFSAGVLGAVGGNVLGMVMFPTLMQVAPGLANAEPPATIMNFFLFATALVLLGGVLFGLAMLVARAPERGAAILIIIGAVLGFGGQMANNVAHLGDIGIALLMLATAWMGLSLMTRHAAEPVPMMEREAPPGAHVGA